MKTLSAFSRRTTRRALRCAAIESLEARIAPATFTVTNTSALNIAGSLLTALNLANATLNVGGPDIIAFNISGSGPFIISPATVYTMTEAVIIDGFTEPGSSANTLAAGDDAVMKIIINGASAGGGIGLRFTSAADGSTVRGLVMNGYTGNAAINFDAGCDGNVVEGCFLGANPAGNLPVANLEGVAVAGSNNTIGGLTPAARNVISGNSFTGVDVNGTGATGNVIEGNFIGLNAAGTGALGNNSSGIALFDAPGTTIGGTTAAARNFISGNGNGISLSAGASNNFFIEGNYIGTDATGADAVGNTGAGVLLTNASHVTISGNLISGNGGFGVSAAGAQPGFYSLTGNIIGLDAGGTVKLPNGGDGVNMANVINVVIGGLTAAERNVISGNGGSGINLQLSDFITIEGNYLGTDATGTLARGNTQDGLLVTGSNHITLGGTAAGAGNVISGNGNFGASIASFSFNFTIQGNFIGPDHTGLIGIGNSGGGLDVQGSDGLIGGTTAAARNIISSNGGDGLDLHDVQAAHVRVLGNYIGPDATGATLLDNGGIGVLLDNIDSVIVGGTGAGEGNIIAGNGVFVDGRNAGVVVANSGLFATRLCLIRGNFIHDNGFDQLTFLPAPGLGLDFSGDGVTPNDPLDADSGINDLQNFPLLLSAASNSAGTTVTGFINTSAGAPLFLDFYANDTTGPNGLAQGQQYLGTIALGADGFGNANFTAHLPAVAAGKYITATATNIGYAPYGNTSEFAQNVVVTTAPNPPPAGGGAPGFALAGFDTGAGPIGIATHDLNGDGFDDIVTADSKSGTVSVLLSNGAGGFADAVAYSTGGKKPTGLVLGDFDSDNHPDLAVTNAGSGSIAILLGLPDGTFGALTTFAVGKNPGALIAGHFDGDSFLDLACIVAGNKVAVRFGAGTGIFDAGPQLAVGKGPVALASGDFNGDGLADLVTANSIDNNVSLLRGTAGGSFAHVVGFHTGVMPVGLAVGDFNGDGVDDLAVAHSVSRYVSVLLSRGAAAGAQFAPQIKIPHAGAKGVRAIAAGDLNGDGHTDLIVANGATGSVSLLLGLGTGLFRGPFETLLTGDPLAVPSALTLGDFNGDGRLDFALAELGASDVFAGFRQS